MRAPRRARPPCPYGRTHTWSFVRNEVVHSQSIGPEHLRVDKRVRGVYQCACGERKLHLPRVARVDS